MNKKLYPILYSFRRCPYAIRARLAIKVSGQTCEIREIILRDKHPQFIKLSPKATVPVLQLSDDTILEESLEIMFWALSKNDPQNWLHPNQGTLQNMQDLIDRNDGAFKLRLDRYKYSIRYDDTDPCVERQKAMEFISDLNEKLKYSDFLFGDKPCLADAAIVPFIRQFANVDQEWFDQQEQPRLHAWLNNILQSDLFISVMKKLNPWQSGNSPVIFPFK